MQIVGANNGSARRLNGPEPDWLLYRTMTPKRKMAVRGIWSNCQFSRSGLRQQCHDRNLAMQADDRAYWLDNRHAAC